MSKQKKIVIGIHSDAFELTCGDVSVYVNQEEDVGEKLQEFFLDLGFAVEIEEIY